MEFLIFIKNVFADKLVNAEIQFSYVLHGTLLLLVLLILPYCLSVFYTKVRRRFPVRVNCWFCCNDAKVPYELSNSWDCPHCQQYNGFNKNGDYNKVIKEQYNPKLNEGVFNTLKNSLVNAGNSDAQTNGFCKLCNINQQLKIQQLALFVPVNEDNYDEEIEEYRLKLENAYKLCSNCETTVKKTLEKQEYGFLQNKLNNQEKKPYGLQKLQNDWKFKLAEGFSNLKRKYTTGLKWLCLCSSVLLFFALIIQFETENQFVPFNTLPRHFASVKPLKSILKMMLVYGKKIYSFRKLISLVGFLCSLLFNDGLGKIEEINSIVWGLVHVVSWSTLTGFQVFVCGISILLNNRIAGGKKIYFLKKSLPKKFSYRPEKRIFSEEYSLGEDPILVPSHPLDSFDGETAGRGSFESAFPAGEIKSVRIGGGKERSPRGKVSRKNAEKNEVEIESLNGEESKKGESGIEASSIFSKSFVASLETVKDEEEEGEKACQKKSETGLDEMYNHLSGLSLGGGRGGGRNLEKKSGRKRKSNFLFESHNFSARKTSPPSSPSPILKPSRLGKNNSNSWTFPSGWSESVSRSSTPSSSGYSSQKPADRNRQMFETAKSMTPISVNAFARRQEFCDYLDGTDRCYNFNCCPHEFLPFQQYHPSGPMGGLHPGLCPTSPRSPAGFSFPLAPPPLSGAFFRWGALGTGAPNRPPTSSPDFRISELSDCENLFRNGSKSFEADRKVARLKTIFYRLSILMNFITILSLAYFFSVGVISLDWNFLSVKFFP